MNKIKQYDIYLKEFVELCEKMTKTGMSYMTVILSHELFRFLYPWEPYINFHNNNPVEFIVQHISRLIDIGRNYLQYISPYNTNFSESISSRFKSNLKITSEMYSNLWKGFEQRTLVNESIKLVRARIPKYIIADYIKGKTVLDMGCGSGRFSIALSMLGARKVVGIDLQEKSYQVARRYCRKSKISVIFKEANCVTLPFYAGSFDFVFCNGVLHHTRTIMKGFLEIKRVLKKGGSSFLYLYGKGGIFWDTRVAMRKVFKKIPLSYSQNILNIIGMPQHRFIFCDSWFVPIETLTGVVELEGMLRKAGFKFKKVISKIPSDLDNAISRRIKDAKFMWGDGEHRYILWKE